MYTPLFHFFLKNICCVCVEERKKSLYYVLLWLFDYCWVLFEFFSPCFGTYIVLFKYRKWTMPALVLSSLLCHFSSHIWVKISEFVDSGRAKINTGTGALPAMLSDPHLRNSKVLSEPDPQPRGLLRSNVSHHITRCFISLESQVPCSTLVGSHPGHMARLSHTPSCWMWAIC